MSWFRVVLEVSADDVDRITDRLQELGAVSVAIVGAGRDDDLVVEPAPGETPLWRHNRLQALFPLDTDATLGCNIAYLGANPEQRRRLVAQPELVDDAVEELLRWETPVTGVPQIWISNTRPRARIAS